MSKRKYVIQIEEGEKRKVINKLDFKNEYVYRVEANCLDNPRLVKGDLIVLSYDDGSECPCFVKVKDYVGMEGRSNSKGDWMFECEITPLMSLKKYNKKLKRGEI